MNTWNICVIYVHSGLITNTLFQCFRVHDLAFPVFLFCNMKNSQSSELINPMFVACEQVSRLGWPGRARALVSGKAARKTPP